MAGNNAAESSTNQPYALQSDLVDLQTKVTSLETSLQDRDKTAKDYRKAVIYLAKTARENMTAVGKLGRKLDEVEDEVEETDDRLDELEERVVVGETWMSDRSDVIEGSMDSAVQTRRRVSRRASTDTGDIQDDIEQLKRELRDLQMPAFQDLQEQIEWLKEQTKRQLRHT